MDLLSATASSYLVRAIKFSGLIGITPYKWHQKSSRVIFINTRRAKVTWWIHNLTFLTYLTFVFGRWIQISLRTSLKNPLALGTLYIFVSYNFATAIQWSLFSNYGEHEIWLNYSIDYIENVRLKSRKSNKSGGEKFGISELKKRQKKRMNNYLKLMRILFVTICTVDLLDTLSAFGAPGMPFFISSLTSNPGKLTTLELVPLVTFHVYIWGLMSFIYFFYTTMLLYYVTMIRNTLDEFKYSNKEHDGQVIQDQGHEIQTCASFCRQMRLLELMQCFCNKIWARTNVFFEMTYIGGCILGFYGSVRLDGARAMQQFVAAIFLVTTLLKLFTDMGDIFELAKGVKESWKMKENDKYFKRYLKSIRPIRMNIGGFFYADRTIRLTLLAIISQNTVTLLLST